MKTIMRDFIHFVQDEVRGFVGSPRTKAEVRPLLENGGSAQYALERFNVQFNEQDATQLTDLVLENIGE